MKELSMSTKGSILILTVFKIINSVSTSTREVALNQHFTNKKLPQMGVDSHILKWIMLLLQPLYRLLELDPCNIIYLHANAHDGKGVLHPWLHLQQF